MKKWGKFFRVTAKIRIAKEPPTGGAQNIMHFTRGEDNSKYGDRVPKVSFSQQKFIVASSINGNSNHLLESEPLESDKTYDLVIEQSMKEDGKIHYEIKVNGEVIHSEVNTDAQDFDNVHVYVASPFSTPFSTEYGRLESLEWTQLQGF